MSRSPYKRKGPVEAPFSRPCCRLSAHVLEGWRALKLIFVHVNDGVIGITPVRVRAAGAPGRAPGCVRRPVRIVIRCGCSTRVRGGVRVCPCGAACRGSPGRRHRTGSGRSSICTRWPPVCGAPVRGVRVRPCWTVIAGVRGSGLIHELDLAEWHRHVVLANPEEPTSPNHHGFGLAVPTEQDLADVADLLVIVVVDIQPPSAWTRATGWAAL